MNEYDYKRRMVDVCIWLESNHNIDIGSFSDYDEFESVMHENADIARQLKPSFWSGIKLFKDIPLDELYEIGKNKNLLDIWYRQVASIG